jgi:hypothetical protein
VGELQAYADQRHVSEEALRKEKAEKRQVRSVHLIRRDEGEAGRKEVSKISPGGVMATLLVV